MSTSDLSAFTGRGDLTYQVLLIKQSSEANRARCDAWWVNVDLPFTQMLTPRLSEFWSDERCIGLVCFTDRVTSATVEVLPESDELKISILPDPNGKWHTLLLPYGGTIILSRSHIDAFIPERSP
jgi:hypothetical protein